MRLGSDMANWRIYIFVSECLTAVDLEQSTTRAQKTRDKLKTFTCQKQQINYRVRVNAMRWNFGLGSCHDVAYIT